MANKNEISITDIENIRIGQTENKEAGTGLTVFISKNGMAAGLDVRGGGPASRESELLKPLAAAQMIHAIVLSGGSAFGLGAANGVMEYLEEHGIGFDVAVTKVPLVVQSDLFDLTVGDPMIRPDAAMGYEAAKHAMEDPNYRDGNYGAGCGATVGKFGGMERCMKSGIGSYAIQIGDLKIGAVVAVNAIGDIFDWKTGQKIAGLLTEDGTSFANTMELLTKSIEVKENRFVENTTLGVIITNASFNKSQLCKIAGMAHDGYARSIRPVHTSVDGDTIYALSVGEISADQDLVGSLAAEVMSEAILRAVNSAESAYGFPSVREIRDRK
ncbi:MAG: P1 family peptidase [Anaerolineaceae bacterium]|nr:P1 family peptidase [Anaerolineaceae bacterium]